MKTTRSVSKIESPQVLLNNLRFDEVVPVSDSGFGLLQNVYSGGRVGAVVNFFGGFNHIEYWGTLPMHHFSRVLFKGDPASAYTRCFRPQVMVGDDAYNLEFSDTSHFPFGYKSHFAIPDRGVEIVHRLTLLNDALVFSIEVLRNDHNLPLRQRFEHHEHCFNGARGRTRSEWKEGIVPAGLVMTAKDVIPDDVWKKYEAELSTRNELNFPDALAQGPREGTAWIALFNDRGLATRTNRARRRYFTGKEFRRGDQACILLFASSRKELVQRAKELRKKVVSIAKAKERDAHRSLARAPQIQTGDKILDSMIANVPLVYEALFVEDIPGTAGTAIAYHIWGWDTLNCPDMHLLSGQVDFARDAIRFYRDTAHPKWGLGHQYTTDMPPKVRVPMPYPAQSVYLIFLYQYGSYVDRSLWRESYAFAKRIFLATLDLINDRGLGEGLALWPDIPSVCGHNGNDISVFNNSIQYQGLRCFEEMAVYAGDKKSAEKARQVCRLMEKNFVPTFWDKKRGYFADSVDSKTGRQRPSYPAHALLWMTPFLHDLVGPDELKACASFMDQNHASPRGYLPYPRWDSSFDGDGNQLGQVWPTHDMFVTRCAAAAGRQDMLEGWIEMSDWFWKQLSYIEGYSAQTVNDSGTLDCTGSKMNFFGTKTTYMAFFTGCAGLHFDVGGVTLSEGIARPLKIRRLPFGKATLDFSLKGKGKFAGKLLVNGKPLVGSLKIPITLLKGKVNVSHERTKQAPAHPVILSLYGAEVKKVGIDRSGNLQAVVVGNTPAWLRYYSRTSATILFDGREIKGGYDRATREGKVLLPLSSSPARLEIGKSSA
jgi:hypothetical protein